MDKYCGQSEFNQLPVNINLNKFENTYATSFLFCSWRLNLNDPYKLITVNFTDMVNKIF